MLLLWDALNQEKKNILVKISTFSLLTTILLNYRCTTMDTHLCMEYFRNAGQHPKSFKEGKEQ